MHPTRAQERLLASIRKNADTGCWEWAGQVSNSGYGRTMLRAEDGSTQIESAHRASYQLFVLCINPDHLELLDPTAGA